MTDRLAPAAAATVGRCAVADRRGWEEAEAGVTVTDGLLRDLVEEMFVDTRRPSRQVGHTHALLVRAPGAGWWPKRYGRRFVRTSSRSSPAIEADEIDRRHEAHLVVDGQEHPALPGRHALKADGWLSARRPAAGRGVVLAR